MCPDHPVENVPWNQVQAYIRKLNKAEELKSCRGTPRDPKGCYRLPTEAEWEYVARGRTTTAYSFGNNRSDLKDYAWYTVNSENKTHPVKTRMANPYGLHDMYGNVCEWVQDNYADVLPGGEDPLVTSGAYRTYRGGSWFDSAKYLRSANRTRVNPSVRGTLVGFRLVRNL